MLKIRIITCHGEYYLPIGDNHDITFQEFLWNKKIPYNSFSCYIFDEHDGKVKPYPCLASTLKEILLDINDKELLLRPDRNLNYKQLLSISKIIYKNDNVKNYVAEYIFNDFNQTNNYYKHVLFNQEDCIKYANNEIKKFISHYYYKDNLYGKNIVVGVSGGGDSNTLLHGLISAGINKENILPVMMMGIPDWDKGLNRAKSICEQEGLKLHIVSSEEVNYLLGRNNKKTDWVSAYEKIYPNSDLEVIGTLAIRLSLSYIAKKNNTNIIVTGLNLEDILAESFFSILNGETFGSFPVRNIGDITLWYPLYRCPKKILDGCHPKFSLENYNDRYPSILYWRTQLYYISQMISNISPGLEFKLIDGLSKISDNYNQSYIYKDELGFNTINNITENDIKKWQEFIQS